MALTAAPLEARLYREGNDVRFGSGADMAVPPSEVRSALKTGHRGHRPASPLWAISRHPPSSLRRSRPLTRQRNDELRKHTGFGLDIDPPPVLFHNDVMGHREPQPCPFPGRFGSEEGVEHLLPYLGRNTRAVVENANFDGLAEISRDRAKDRLKVPIGCLCFAFCRCIEAVGNQI